VRVDGRKESRVVVVGPLDGVNAVAVVERWFEWGEVGAAGKGSGHQWGGGRHWKTCDLCPWPSIHVQAGEASLNVRITCEMIG
jgi:hypothetical protein